MISSIEEIKSKKREHLKGFIHSNDSFLSFMTANKDAIFVLDLDTHLFQVNPAFENLFGSTSKKARGDTKFSAFIPLEELDQVLNYFHKTILGDFENFNCKMIREQNETLDVNIMMIPIVVGQEVVGIYGIVKDLTSIKRMETEVRKIEEIHRVMTENILDVIISSNRLGEILYISPSCKTMLGYGPHELMGSHLFLLFHEEDVNAAIRNRERVLTLQESGRHSYRIRKKDGGGCIWVEMVCKPVVDSATGNIVEVVSVIRDITQQKKDKEEIWKRKKMFRDIIEHSPDGVIISIENKIAFINQTGLELFGAKKEEELLHRSIFSLLFPEYRPIAIERSKRVAQGEVVDFIEYKMIRVDGTSFDVELKGIPTIYRNVKANYLFFRDVTERKKTQEMLVQAEKLNVAGQLAAGIAHEVRNPLTAIKGFLQLLSMEITEKKSYLEIVQSEIGRIEHILSELLTLSKPKNMLIQKVELKDVLHDVKTLIDTEAIMHNIKVEIEFDCHDSLVIQCDKNQIKQVFINFLKNSIEAMVDGGELMIEVVKHGMDRIKVLIKDTGPGIPQEIIQRIGEPFFTTKENGTGLGIMISKQIIENHHGSVHIWSDHKGTMIEIILPLDGGE